MIYKFDDRIEKLSLFCDFKSCKSFLILKNVTISSSTRLIYFVSWELQIWHFLNHVLNSASHLILTPYQQILLKTWNFDYKFAEYITKTSTKLTTIKVFYFIGSSKNIWSIALTLLIMAELQITSKPVSLVNIY